MNSDFRVSVAIPAYNEASRIGTAIASALAQTEPPAEILVVDDGSTDETVAVATALGARVVVQRNGGVARARNRLLAETRTPWLAFLDADDVWLPEKLAWARRAHEAAPDAGFIISDLRCIRASGALAKKSVFADTPQFVSARKTPVAPEIVRIDGGTLGRALAVGNFIGTCTAVVRHAEVIARGCTFDESLPRTADVFVAEDVEWYLRLLRDTDAVAVTRVLAEYRWRDGSLSANYGRVRYGDVKLGERVAAFPDAYVAGAAATFARERRAQLRHAARIYARSRELARARDLLLEAQRDGFDVRDSIALALLACAGVPPGRAAFDLMLRLWARARL